MTIFIILSFVIPSLVSVAINFTFKFYLDKRTFTDNRSVVSNHYHIEKIIKSIPTEELQSIALDVVKKTLEELPLEERQKLVSNLIIDGGDLF